MIMCQELAEAVDARGPLPPMERWDAVYVPDDEIGTVPMWFCAACIERRELRSLPRRLEPEHPEYGDRLDATGACGACFAELAANQSGKS